MQIVMFSACPERFVPHSLCSLHNHAGTSLWSPTWLEVVTRTIKYVASRRCIEWYFEHGFHSATSYAFPTADHISIPDHLLLYLPSTQHIANILWQSRSYTKGVWWGLEQELSIRRSPLNTMILVSISIISSGSHGETLERARNRVQGSRLFDVRYRWSNDYCHRFTFWSPGYNIFA